MKLALSPGVMFLFHGRHIVTLRLSREAPLLVRASARRSAP